MQEKNAAQQTLDLLNYPAFSVRAGKIEYCNEPASALFLRAGDEILPLLHTGIEEYKAYKKGHLYLTISIGDMRREATVINIDGSHLFLLSDAQIENSLQTISLTAQQLRMPLSDIIAETNMLFSSQAIKEDPGMKSRATEVSRTLHQLIRMVGNMSDAARYAQAPGAHMMTLEVTSLFSEVMEKAAILLSQGGITLTYDGPPSPIHLCGDSERIERAVYNLISNAAKYSPDKCTIRSALTRKKDMLYFTITNPGQRIPQEIQQNVFNRFLRQPGLTDCRFGLGLGLSIVHNTATAHGGTVLLESLRGGGIRITMSIKIRQAVTPMVRNPILLDYASGYDHGLLELSDVLPTIAYETEF